MENSFDPKTEIKQYLEKTKEEFTSDYSLNSLENYAQLLLDLIEKWESREGKILEKIYFVKHNILNFKSDFSDDIPKNYDNKNRSHREKWTIESRKLNGLKSEFLKVYEDYYNK
ncbi:hypothetical protein N7U66_04940 [Lacinutrix neustonica]|uniref:Uncharacterized protein n=1 Tax=Lacinutrix neustonica TaxID=2980107 RepID=A0A9E8MWK6_9FLAO|nr:hypothetical protein [Lacinutrix neustonica]WAC02977.1 hypothetical protein N7U66_04940 [Lacinutrix neustonica]